MGIDNTAYVCHIIYTIRTITSFSSDKFFLCVRFNTAKCKLQDGGGACGWHLEGIYYTS